MNPGVKGTGSIAETGVTAVISGAPSGWEEIQKQKIRMKENKEGKSAGKCSATQGLFPLPHSRGDPNHEIWDHLFILLYPFGKP